MGEQELKHRSMSEAREEFLVVYYCWCWHKNKALISRTPFFWNCRRMFYVFLFFSHSQKFFIWKISRVALKSWIILEHGHLSVHITFGIFPCHFIRSPLEALYTFIASIITSGILPQINLWLSPLFWTSVSTVQMSVGHLCMDVLLSSQT